MIGPAFALSTTDADFETKFEAMLSCKRSIERNIHSEVAAIIDAVRNQGLEALLGYTAQFDRWSPTVESLKVAPADFTAARESCPKPLLRAFERAAERIDEFHRRQLESLKPVDYVDADGIRLGSHWTPVDAAGLYAPGGLAAYPSSVLMNAIPAHVAGVERIIMAVPAPDGHLNPLVLAAAEIAGVKDIWKIGGAQAIAALAWGCGDQILPVDKITGPGNAWVAEAKRQVFGRVGIDMIAGPSEVCIVADSNTPPDWAAMDLLAQAEHDASAQSVLLTDDAAYGSAVADAVAHHLKTLSRSEIASKSWENFGAIVICRSLSETPALINRLAPEHLQLAVEAPEALKNQVRHAGAIFLGCHTPEAVGDYIAGPNHVLPTSGSARFSSGLNVLDFMKRTTWVGTDAEGLSRLANDIAAIAEAEGLEAHQKSVLIRSNA